jgi:hypothetical protein
MTHVDDRGEWRAGTRLHSEHLLNFPGQSEAGQDELLRSLLDDMSVESLVVRQWVAVIVHPKMNVFSLTSVIY